MKIRRPDEIRMGDKKMTEYKTRRRKSKFRRKVKNVILMAITYAALAAAVIVVAMGVFTVATVSVAVASVIWIWLFYIANAVAA